MSPVTCFGEGGTHAWVEVLVVDDRGGARAVAFDPVQRVPGGAGRTSRSPSVATTPTSAPTSGRFTGATSGALRVRKHLGVTAAA